MFMVSLSLRILMIDLSLDFFFKLTHPELLSNCAGESVIVKVHTDVVSFNGLGLRLGDCGCVADSEINTVIV